jgi:hypothetical protein
MAISSRITKAELASQLATARARVSQLEVQLIAERSATQELRELYARVKQRHAVAMPDMVMVNTVPVTPPKEQVARILNGMPQYQVERSIAMARARSLAMASNQMVKV